MRQGQLARKQAALIEKARRAYIEEKFIPEHFSKTPEEKEAYLRFIGIK